MNRRALNSILMLAVAGGCNCSSGASVSGPQVAAPTSAMTDTNVPSHPGAAKALKLPPLPAPDPREAILARAVSQFLQAQHLKARPIDDAMAKQAIEYFIEHLDPGKQFLLQPQVAALRERAAQLGDQLASGDLKLARLGTALLTQQRNKVAAMVADLTVEPFDLADKEALQTDPEKRDFVQGDEELKQLWRRLLELQVLERMSRMRRAFEARAEQEKEQTGEADAQAKKQDKVGAPPEGQGRAKVDDPTVAGRSQDEAPPATETAREQKARAELSSALAGRFQRRATPEPLEAAETLLNAVAAVYGPHTAYLAPDDKANFDISMTGSLEGIGAILSEGDHFIEVREVVPGGAAWRQGDLSAGDLIMAVAQQDGTSVDVTDMRLAEVVKMIRGPKGTIVTLSIRKPDGRNTAIVITRDVVIVEATYARGALLKLGPKQPPVGYVYLPSFYGNTRGKRGEKERNASEDVSALLERFQKRNVKSAILDLRGNGGGLLSEATQVAGLFIQEGPVVQVRRSDGDVQVLSDEDPRIAFDGRLLVMVDRFSASASEIVAGALQDYGRALVVGTGPTHGKGTVQMLAELDRLVRSSPGPLGVFKLTTQQYFLVDGESTQQRGVRPDIVLADPLPYVEAGERFLDNPVPWSKIDALPHRPWEGVRWNVSALAERSRTRTAKSEAFEHIKARGRFLLERKEDTLVPLQQAAWRARSEAQDKALKEFEREGEDEPAMLSSEPVSYRSAKARAQDDADAREAAAARLEKWRKQLERDPWVEEALSIVRDATSGATKFLASDTERP
ncbi:MAG: carboxy terminal-processing peptidase [Myxococcales bacterium]|nr:carboxy terminal-processing peptidase [Myxococcales bacterium]MDD9965063.1 carboxy terminal-processing peptidase [Myxococcales bacterium]